MPPRRAWVASWRTDASSLLLRSAACGSVAASPDRSAAACSSSLIRSSRERLAAVRGGASGAVPGEYRVEIQVIERTTKGVQKLIPDKYNEKSELKFTVPSGGTKEADFDVKTK